MDFVSKMLEETTDAQLTKTLTEKFKELYSAQQKIQGGISSGLCQAFKSELKEEGFHEKVDANLDVIGFKNGVYDLSNEQFRSFHIDDIVTMSTGYDYVSGENENDDDV